MENEKVQEEIYKEDADYLLSNKRKLNLKSIADFVRLLIKEYKKK